MVALPAGLQGLALPREFRLASGGEGLVALAPRDRDEAFEHVCEKEAHPYAGADLVSSEHINAVIPVAGAEQGQPILAEMLERVSDGEPRVLIDSRALA